MRQEEKSLEIRLLRAGDPLWEETAAFARGCSWRAGPVLAARMEERRFLDWERVIVALAEGKVAGYCALTARDELPEGTDYSPFVGFVFVDEAHRGKRISERMIGCAARYAGSLGYRTLYVMSGEEGLYEKYGFERLGEYETIYGTTDRLFRKAIGD